jgi:maltoporin
MRPVLQLLGLSGLLATGFVPTQAFAQEPENADAQQPTEEQKAEPQAPTVPAAPVVAPEAAAVVAPSAKPKVGDLTTHGYFRGGFGGNLNQKGRMTCFQLALDNGILSKYRLGNECEVWGELDLTSVVYAGDDGTVANLHFMPVAYIPNSYIGYTPTGVTSSGQGEPNSGATVAFPNLYIDIKGISWLAGGTPWAGTRYYKRESIYISDFFYWNPSGVGAGIEDIDIGALFDGVDSLRNMRFSYGAFAVDGQPSSKTKPALPQVADFGVRNDLQLRGIRPYRSGELQIGFQYIANWSDKDDPTSGNSNTKGGWGVTVRHVQDLPGGDNKLVFQYGKGAGTGFGTLGRFYYPDFSIYYLPEKVRIRALDVLTIQPTSYLGLQANFVYQHDDDGSGKSGAVATWYSAGARVSISVTEHAKLLAEAGYDHVQKNNGAGPQWLQKFTFAPAIAGARGFWGRPELRLFVTYARWSEDAVKATIDSGQVYTSPDENGGYKLNAMIAGFQGEAMW